MPNVDKRQDIEFYSIAADPRLIIPDKTGWNVILELKVKKAQWESSTRTI